MELEIVEPNERGLRVEDWGLVPYGEAVDRQLQIVDRIIHSVNTAGADLRSHGVLVFCSHPPVVTRGRATKPGDVFGWSGEVIETSRGGRATYHGPSQIVAYPIGTWCCFERRRSKENEKDSVSSRSMNLHGYLRALENAIVSMLREFEITSEARTVKASDDGPSLTGVWVGNRKIASIGIAVRKWVTYHGLALNVSNDPQAFSGINPCGFRPEIMTSVEEVLGRSVERKKVQHVLQGQLVRELGFASSSPD